MTKEKKNILIILYYSLRDPLCEGLILSHIKSLTSDATRFYLITYEQEKFQYSDKETKELQRSLDAKFQISWYPMKYRSGRFFMIKKVISAFEGLRMSWVINQKNKLSLICAMGTLAGTFAFITSRILQKPFCQFTYEPHALIMMQSGRMSANSLRFKLARYFENKIGLCSEYVVCTTRHMVDELRKSGAQGKLLRLPSSVDESLHQFDALSRKTIRAKFGIHDDSPVLIYPGKFGGMYRQKETIQLITHWLEIIANSHAIIITDHSLETIKGWMREYKTNVSRLHLMSTVPLVTLHQYTSAADIGLIAYEDFESRKYCSPVKTGEYLMCGIPYIVQSGTSEDDEVAISENVGVVINSFDNSSLDASVPRLLALLSEDKAELRGRCRNVGIAYRGKKNALVLMQKIFEDA